MVDSLHGNIQVIYKLLSLLRCCPIRTEINASFELHIRIKLKPVDKRGNGKDLTNNNYWGKKANKNRHLYFRLVFFGIDSAHLCIEYKLKQTVFMHDITGSFSHHITSSESKLKAYSFVWSMWQCRFRCSCLFDAKL